MGKYRPEWLEGFSAEQDLRSILNIFWYQWRRVNWAVSPRAWWCDPEEVHIDRPIFFIGNQGAGLSLISRMIRRKEGIVSVTGGHKYWSGADEMQRVMAPRLPPALRLTGNVLRGEPPHQKYSPPRSWTYASDDLFNAYHMTEDDYTPERARTLRSIIAESIYRFGDKRGEKRFVDKSQVYTLKIRLIDALLRETDPHFILVTRNPYAACYRAASGRALDMQRYAEFLDFEERLSVCANHWANAIGCALQDGERVEYSLTVRFEDFLADPKSVIRKICEFTGIEFANRMIPAQDDQIPFGTRFKDRWYPIRKDVNKKYLQEITNNQSEVVKSYVNGIAKKLGYSNEI